MTFRTKTLPANRQGELYNFPSFHKSGSIKGMKKTFYGEDALLIRCGQYIYHMGNIYDKDEGNVLNIGKGLYFFDAK